MPGTTYIEVRAEGTEDDRRLLLVSEEEHLGLAWVVVLEDVVVCGGDIDDTVADVAEGHLLEHVGVELVLTTVKVLRWHWEGRVDTVQGKVFLGSLFLAKSWLIFAVNSANTEHFLLLDAELLELALIALRLGVYITKQTVSHKSEQSREVSKDHERQIDLKGACLPEPL